MESGAGAPKEIEFYMEILAVIKALPVLGKLVKWLFGEDKYQLVNSQWFDGSSLRQKLASEGYEIRWAFESKAAGMAEKGWEVHIERTWLPRVNRRYQLAGNRSGDERQLLFVRRATSSS